MFPALALLALLSSGGAAGPFLLDRGPFSEEVARNSVEWLKPPRADAEDHFRGKSPLYQNSRLRGEFVPSPQLPAAHLELDSTPTGLSFTFEDARLGPPQAAPAPVRFPYPGKPTGHFDLTYNSTGLNFTEVSSSTPSTELTSSEVSTIPPSSSTTPASEAPATVTTTFASSSTTKPQATSTTNTSSQEYPTEEQ